MVASAVLSSPAWRRILLVWVYDEHGGYYDHVPPPAAIPPDSIAPRLGPNDPPGGYDIYGPRVPAVVMSAYSRPGGVTNVVHDHTSILATIEAKWNLPAMTYRDANAATMADFLDPVRLAFPEPPTLSAPYDLAQSESSCSLELPPFTVYQRRPGAAGPGSSSGTIISGAQHLVVRFYGRRHRLHGVLVQLYTTEGILTGLTIELRRGKRLLARAHAAHVGTARHRVVLKPRRDGHLPKGSYTLLVTQGTQALVKRRVRVGRVV